eukprot:3207219-Amphidinium_carterae.1
MPHVVRSSKQCKHHSSKPKTRGNEIKLKIFRGQWQQHLTNPTTDIGACDSASCVQVFLLNRTAELQTSGGVLMPQEQTLTTDESQIIQHKDLIRLGRAAAVM